MKYRNYTREILDQISDGKMVAVATVLGTHAQYDPRSKSDPMPWLSSGFRYTGREVHAVPACGERLLHMSGRFTKCNLPEGHDKAHRRVTV
jgi:hypothetical protein